MERECRIKRSWMKKLGLFCLAVFAMLVCYSKDVRAAVTRKEIPGGFTLNGTASVNVAEWENFRYDLDYSIPDVKNNKMDYIVDISITFHTSDSRKIPRTVEMNLGYEQIEMHPNGAATCKVRKQITTEYGFDLLTIDFDYGGAEEPEGQQNFTLDLKVQENRKKPVVEIASPGTLSRYEKTSEYYIVTVKDPYVTDPVRNSSKYSVKISDPSVAKISGIQNIGTNADGDSRLNITVTYLKSGSAELIFQYQDVIARKSFAVQKTQIIVPKSLTMYLGERATLVSYIGKAGGGTLSVKKIKSGNRAVVNVSGKSLVAKKLGKTKITAVINGKKQTIKVTVVKKPVPKPTLKQLKVSCKGYNYYPHNGKMYLKVQLKNNSKSTITKVQLRYSIPLDETVIRTKTIKVNIKPKKSVTKKFLVGTVVAAPDGKISVKCLKFWYKN